MTIGELIVRVISYGLAGLVCYVIYHVGKAAGKREAFKSFIAMIDAVNNESRSDTPKQKDQS